MLDRREYYTRIRIKLIYWLFVLLFLLVVFRCFYLQVIAASSLARLQLKQVTKYRHGEFRRGDIYDRNNIPLAVDKDAYSVYLDKRNIDESDKQLELVKIALNIDNDILIQKFRSSNTLINLGTFSKDNISPIRYGGIAVEGKKYDIDGLQFDNNYIRNYPWGNVGSTLIGAAGKDRIGLEGVEYSFNSHLSGTKSGYILTMRDALGREWLSKATPKNTPGKSLQLYLDIQLTNIVHKFTEGTYSNSPRFSLVINADNNEVIAGASLPDFDPNIFTSFNTNAMANRSVRQLFTPGASVDLLYYIIYNLIGENDIHTYNINGANVKVIDCNSTITKYKSANTNIPLILHSKRLHSINILGNKVSQDLSGQETGYFPNPSELNTIISNNGIIGNSVICNPLQLTTLYAKAFLNKELRPRIVMQSTQVVSNVPAKPNMFVNDNAILYANGKTELGITNFVNAKHHKQLHLLVGWFYAMNHKYILVLGCESGEAFELSKFVSKWNSIKNMIVAYMVDPSKYRAGFDDFVVVNNKLRDLEVKFNDLNKAISYKIERVH